MAASGAGVAAELSVMDIVLVDDHPAVRAGLRGLVEDEDGLRVAATAATAREGFEAIADTQPAGRAASTSTCPTTTASRCACARAALPAPPRVIIYSAFADAGLAVRAAIAGAEGVLPKADAAARCCSTRCADGARRAARRRARCARVGERLDAADLPILGMLAHGVGQREIAATLGLEPEWLEARRWAMLARLGAASRDGIPLAAA